jgi:hypothetical protein
MHVLLVVFAGLLAYSATFDVPFFFDDIPSIRMNPEVRDLRIVPSMFVNIEGSLGLRPLLLAGFALDFLVAGENTAWYHLINGALLYLLVLKTGPAPSRPFPAFPL